MALRTTTTLLLSLLLLSTSILTTTSSPIENPWALNFIEPASDNLLEGTSYLSTCNGKVGDCDGDTYEEVGTDLEAAVRRSLQWRKRYISYDALKKNRVPCNRRGQSYYNCQRGRQANPYRRGCSFITKCARIMNWWTTLINKPCIHVHYWWRWQQKKMCSCMDACLPGLCKSKVNLIKTLCCICIEVPDDCFITLLLFFGDWCFIILFYFCNEKVFCKMHCLATSYMSLIMIYLFKFFIFLICDGMGN